MFWPTRQELTDLLQEGEIKGPVDEVFLVELHRREPGKTIEYQELGKIGQEKYRKAAAHMALSADCTLVFYDYQQKVSAKNDKIIIGMNFHFYQANAIQVYRNEE